MSTWKTHRDLLAWREAMSLVELIYRETASFPRDERYGLTAQLRRAAISIPSNLSEGAARNSTREFAQYIGITCGSLAELETQLELSIRLGFLKPESGAIDQTRRVGKFVTRLRRAVQVTKEVTKRSD